MLQQLEDHHASTSRGLNSGSKKESFTKVAEDNGVLSPMNNIITVMNSFHRFIMCVRAQTKRETYTEKCVTDSDSARRV